jgi:hypothetical protein
MSFYLSEGTQVIGPLNANDVIQYSAGEGFDASQWQVCDQSHQWKSLFSEIKAIKDQTSNLARRDTTEPDPDNKGQSQKGHKPEEALFIADSTGAIKVMAEIRNELQGIWTRQVERIVAVIRNREPAREFEVTAKEFRDIRSKLNDLIVDFWRKEGTLNEWIADLTWGEPAEVGDYLFSLSGKTPDEKMNEIREHLVRTKIDHLEGCYCFVSGNEYLYIGQTTKQTLSIRILQGHKGKAFWLTTDSIRILIPSHMAKAKKLERLLILAHDPKENELEGGKKSQADDVLNMIETELEELTQP